MKKIITLSLCATALTLTANTMAFNWPWSNKKADKKSVAAQPVTKQTPKTASKKAVVTTVALYNAPDPKAQVLKQLPINTNLVAIFRKGEWVKVGDRQDGATGWINIKQYHHAKQAFYRNYFHEKTETIYYHSEKGKDGKTSIVAYRNGKKLSDKQAKKLFHHLQQQEKRQWREMERFNRVMNFPFMMMPGIVVIDQQPKAKEKDLAVKK